MTTSRAPHTFTTTAARAGGVVLAAGLLAGFGLAPSSAQAKSSPKVAICHATSSTSNPYIRIVVPASSLDGKGKNDHTAHMGGLFDFSDPASGSDWGDIIPDAAGAASSLNATLDGLGILANGCNGPDEGSCPDGSDPVGDECPTEETCPNGQAATDGECDDEENVVLCEGDLELTADDPSCGEDEGDVDVDVDDADGDDVDGDVEDTIETPQDPETPAPTEVDGSVTETETPAAPEVEGSDTESEAVVPTEVEGSVTESETLAPTEVRGSVTQRATATSTELEGSVTQPGMGATSLPATGASTLPTLQLALGLIALGGALVAGSRRARGHQQA